jgi:phosphopantothenoylcysteine synthetase/decarboxylase
MNILITGGGCREAIDNVRCVTNTSTGRTSAIIADYFSAQGCQVTALTAATAIKPQGKCTIRTFVSGADLGRLLEEELTAKEYHLVIHAAAVSDFIPETVIMDGVEVAAGPEGKIPSGSSMVIKFKAAPKLADRIKGWSRDGGHQDPTVICFKLTSGAEPEKVLAACHAILARGAADFVVANDILNITSESHPFAVNILQDNQVVAFDRGETEEEMAKILYKIATQTK